MIKQKFSNIYKNNTWGNIESLSGPGSTLKATENIKPKILNIINKYKIKSILDAPCGDMNWMKEIVHKFENYIGVDIVEDMIEKNKKEFNNKKNIDFKCIDITKDELPEVDLIFSRDCIQHLPNRDIIKFINNIKKSNSKYLLIGTTLNINNENRIYSSAYEWQYLNLEEKPFNFPKAIEYIEDYGSEEDFRPDTFLALYKVNDLHMVNNVNILDKNECTGCKVCYQVCPHDAITIIENKEGLKYPIIDDNKCTNCSICVKKCHALNDNFETEFEQQIYDVRASDDIRMKSSSGGMFTLVANYVLENNGYVCGASFTNDWLGVEHIIINDKKYLDKLRGSKYIESNLGNCFSEIKKLLNENNLVLFTGCPCQVSALKSYLNKDYNNLITADIFCNSIIPNNIWVKYLKEQFTEEEIKNIEYISFRDKKKINWDVRLYIKLKEKEYIDEIYRKLFSEHIATKEECYNCQYRRYERVSDITLGDHWDEKNNDNKGVSLVLINTEKGNNVFNKIKNNCKYKNITEKKSDIINGGINLKYTSDKREYFFNNIDNDTLENLYQKANKFDVGFIGFWFAPNYGAILTNYALYKVLENLYIRKTTGTNEHVLVKDCTDAMKKALTSTDPNAYASVKAGRNITALEIIEKDNGSVWVRNYSGYLCLKGVSGQVYLEFVE